MKTPRILWTLSALLLAASPAAAYDAYGFQFDAGNLSHCYVVNVAAYPMVMGCVVQDMTNAGNPVDLGHGVSRLLQPGESQELTYAVRVPACAKAQIDGLINLQPWQLTIERWTESDIVNNRVTALGQYVQVGECGLPPPPPPTPPQEPPCVSKTYTFGGTPAIGRFPDGFQNPWLPTYRGPFYLAVPVGVYRVTSWSGDEHVGPNGKYDGRQNEIGLWWANTGQVFGPTNPIPEDQNLSFTDFGVRALTAPISYFFLLHAATGPVTAPTDSFYPVVFSFECVQGGQ